MPAQSEIGHFHSSKVLQRQRGSRLASHQRRVGVKHLEAEQEGADEEGKPSGGK